MAVKKYIIVTLYSLLLIVQVSSTMEYSILASSFKNFYGVSTYYINIASVSGSVTMLFLSTLAAQTIKNYGIRVNIIFAATCVALGNVVKLFSMQRNLYAISVVGQYIISLGTPFSFTAMLLVPQVWFSPNNFSLVFSIIQSSYIVGGLLIPFGLTQVATTSMTKFAQHLDEFTIAKAVISVTLFIAIVILFDERPLSDNN
ncbi:feline leukemia virus subgroup C receptor-related protein 2-like protein, partial [Leptotrombidium deliense]